MEPEILARSRRRMVLRLVLLAMLFVGPAVAGYVWGSDAFFAAAFGTPAAGLAIWAFFGNGGSGGAPRNWPRAG